MAEKVCARNLRSRVSATLTLGIPGDAIMALMLAALTIQGIQPGPSGRCSLSGRSCDSQGGLNFRRLAWASFPFDA